MNVRDELIDAGMLRPGDGTYRPRDQEISVLVLPDGATVFRTDELGRRAAARDLEGPRCRGQRDLGRSTHELAALQRWR